MLLPRISRVKSFSWYTFTGQHEEYQWLILLPILGTSPAPIVPDIVPISEVNVGYVEFVMMSTRAGDGIAADVICVECDGTLESLEFRVKFNSKSNITKVDCCFPTSVSPAKKQKECADQFEAEPLQNEDIYSEVNIYSNKKRCPSIKAIVDHSGLVYFIEASRAFVTKPSSSILKDMNLNPGRNILTFELISQNIYIESYVWLYKPTSKFVVVDIDGTITRSDVRGYLETVYLDKYTYIHDGIISLLHRIHTNYPLQLVFLTSRPLAHQPQTRSFLNGMSTSTSNSNSTSNAPHGVTPSTDGCHLPQGPLLMNSGSYRQILYQELIAKTSGIYKSNVLGEINKIFRSITADVTLCPLVFGFGNRPTDLYAYSTSGIQSDRIFIIDKRSIITVSSSTTISTTTSTSTTATHVQSQPLNDDNKKPVTTSGNTLPIEKNSATGGVVTLRYKSYCDNELLKYIDHTFTSMSTSSATSTMDANI
eukprot:gene12901-27215_t